tara:strand:- start:199 stop:450 length:252 start_codon:yes stop_codon:yes gene_type:complete
MRPKRYTEQEVKRLDGLVETITERTYPLAQGVRRCNGTMPRDLTPGGTPILIEVEQQPGTRAKRYQPCWFVPQATLDAARDID